MVRLWVVALGALLFGALIGSMVASRNARQHPQVRAVMWLGQFHLDRLLDAAAVTPASAAQCETAQGARRSLQFLSEELKLALPKAYAQDAEFRRLADNLAHATAAPAAHCTEQLASAPVIQEACDACHRAYRQ